MWRRPLVPFWLLTIGTPVVVFFIALPWHGGLLLGSAGLLGGAAAAFWTVLANRAATRLSPWCAVLGGPLTLVSAVLFAAVEEETAIPVGQFLGLVFGFTMFTVGAFGTKLKPGA